MGDTSSITIVDSSETEIKINLASSLLDRSKKRKEFSSIYSHMLSFIAERQWKELLQHINNGKRISFKVFDIAKEGIYFKDRRIFHSGFEKPEPNRILGSAIRNGDFYIHFVNDKRKVMERWTDNVKSIPNLHIAQRYFELLRSTYFKKANN